MNRLHSVGCLCAESMQQLLTTSGKEHERDLNWKASTVSGDPAYM